MEYEIKCKYSTKSKIIIIYGIAVYVYVYIKPKSSESGFSKKKSLFGLFLQYKKKRLVLAWVILTFCYAIRFYLSFYAFKFSQTQNFILCFWKPSNNTAHCRQHRRRTWFLFHYTLSRQLPRLDDVILS